MNKLEKLKQLNRVWIVKNGYLCPTGVHPSFNNITVFYISGDNKLRSVDCVVGEDTSLKFFIRNRKNEYELPKAIEL